MGGAGESGFALQPESLAAASGALHDVAPSLVDLEPYLRRFLTTAVAGDAMPTSLAIALHDFVERWGPALDHIAGEVQALVNHLDYSHHHYVVTDNNAADAIGSVQST